MVIGTNCVISIHALLAESDAQHFSTLHNILISIHALLAESDLSIPITGFLERISIHALLAESDRTGYHSRADRTHFYPRSPCGERLNIRQIQKIENGISIHALLAESDNNINSSVNTADQISIHALLAESDSVMLVESFSDKRHFYPRSPCGERLVKMSI